MRVPVIRDFNYIDGRTFYLPVPTGECWKCDKVRPDLAHAVYEYVAALLAERLRRAYDEHRAACAKCQGEMAEYLAAAGRYPCERCPERERLCDLLPEGDWPVAIA